MTVHCAGFSRVTRSLLTRMTGSIAVALRATTLALLLTECSSFSSGSSLPREWKNIRYVGCSSRIQSAKLDDYDLCTHTETQSAESSSRRAAISSMIGGLALSISAASANAYEKAFPLELEAVDGAPDGRQRMKDKIMAKEAKRVTPATKPESALLWSAALWLLSGSRSNPLATPLANVFYDEKEENWLKDRNDGLFANLPIPIYIALAILFVTMGIGTDALIVNLSDGDQNISFQLAGVSLIGGASLELGRIASGEKSDTREESDRASQLEEEFTEFAEKRLQPGGNCHKTDVIRSFRRYFAKYRQADDPEYPLTDLEIERLLKAWSRMRGIDMSPAGFLNGLKVNQDADITLQR